ncbi:hypothetical protein FOA52_014870 [Chlamydomonas sp. UWO 241]|nr:hypothetical protein FOA52_014870 [Chlamydomonas sp. UWO 241]
MSAAPVPSVGDTAVVAPSGPPSMLAATIARLKEAGATVLKQAKPWSELIDRNMFSKPENMGDALTRVKKNLAYFRINYFVVLLATCAVTFVMNPSSLFVLGLLLAGWIYVLFLRTSPLEIGGRTLSEREKLIGMSAVSFITIFFLTSVGTVFFSALSFSAAVIAVHASFREPDNLFVDEGPAESQSFLGILTGTPTASAV